MKTYVQLGKAGDIMSLLPLLHHESLNGEKPSLMVSRDYASILEGCSYVSPIVLPDGAHRLDLAMDKLNGTSDVIVTQMNGPFDAVKKFAFERAGFSSVQTDSFVKDMWNLAGKLPLWKQSLPLIFDQRDKKRETKIYDEYFPSKGKVLLVSLSGTSSPFPYAELLTELLQLKLKGWKILDISTIQAERIYDLLVLFESASALIASDSANLHLSTAVKTLPVFALISDSPGYWHGSPWRPNHVWHCRYNDFPKRYNDLFDTLNNYSRGWLRHSKKLDDSCIVHLYNRCEETKANKEFVAKARESWKEAYATDDWLPCYLDPGSVGKDSTHIGDKERYPFLRSALQLGLMKCAAEDLLVVTRATTCFNGDITDSIRINAPCYAFRRVGSDHFPTVDLFAAPVKFWEEIWSEIPDLIMGRDRAWSEVLLHIFLEHKATELRGIVHSDKEPVMPKATWPYIADVPPRLKHNTETLKNFRESKGIRDFIPNLRKQAEFLPLNPKSLPAYAYNPSICVVGDKYWIAYRFHGVGSVATQLGIAEIEPHGNAVRSARLAIPAHSVEDPRFFRHKGNLWLSWVESDYSGQIRPHSVVKFGRLTDDWKIDSVIQPNYGKNDWTDMEKNWVPFSTGWGWQYMIYQTEPTQVVLAIDELSGKIEELKSENKIKWAYGPIKGGVMTDGIVGGKLLRFFHSTLDNEDGWKRRYYVGALLMEPEPPFNVVSISREPLLIGSNEDDFSESERTAIPHFKGKVVFPGGAVSVKDGWLLSVGINDCACGLVKITDLKL